MSEILVKIGELEEKWNDWIMPGGKNEYDKLPGPLKPYLRSLARRPEALTPPDKLTEYYDLIDKLSLEPNSGETYSDAAPYLGRITEKIRRMVEASPERTASLRELPLHIGAVFKDGRNWLQVEHESIPILNIQDEQQREVYMM